MLFLRVPQSISPTIAKVKFVVQGTHSSLQTLGSEQRQQALSHEVQCWALHRHPRFSCSQGATLRPGLSEPVDSQPSSATQASQPSSCPGSRALGFRAPGSLHSSVHNRTASQTSHMILQKFKGEEGIFRLIWQVRQQGSPMVSLAP